MWPDGSTNVKLERAWYNLLNACEARPPLGGKVEITAGEVAGSIAISAADKTDSGIAESIRERLFSSL